VYELEKKDNLPTLRNTKMKKLGFIFDMDGTMIDSMGYHAQSWALFAEAHHLKQPLETILKMTTGRTCVECMDLLFERPIDTTTALAYVDHKESLYRDLFEADFREVRGFKAFIERITKLGIPWAMGTAGDRTNIAFALKHLALQYPPQVVVGGDEGHRGKPEPDIFLAAARGLGMAPENCVVFEDAPFGIEAARRGGMRAVGLATSHEANELWQPHVLAVANNYDDLLTLPEIQALLEPH